MSTYSPLEIEPTDHGLPELGKDKVAQLQYTLEFYLNLFQLSQR